MKRIITILILSLSVLITLGLTSFEIMSPDGAPAAQTGSPGDGSNCTSCHGGNIQNVSSGWITTDIPAEGYTPGQTYQITCTNTLTGSGKYGFQCSPQNIAGALLGTLTAGTNNKLVGSGKYVTHTAANTSNNSWTFSWTAPAATIGSVTFYAAFVKGPSANVAKTSLTVTKASGLGLAEETQDDEMKVFPNPGPGQFNISNIPGQAKEIRVTDVAGNPVIFKNSNTNHANDMVIDLVNRPAGVYFLSFIVDGKSFSRKLVVN